MNIKTVFTCLIILLCYTSCKPHAEEKKEEVSYLVTSPLRKDTLVTKEYVAQIRAIQHIELRVLDRGYLQHIFVDEGQMVQKGQLMFQLLPLQYQAEMQKAQAEADYAQIEYKNTKFLADSNVVSANQLALTRAKLQQAQAELSLTQVHLGFATIRAPFTGIMDRFQVRLGSLLEEGNLLTTLSDITQIWVYFNVPEAEYLDYKATVKKDSVMAVQLKMANNVMFKHPGQVKAIEADFDNETGTIAFRATFDNPEGLLRHGETGNIVVNVPLKNALIIPQKATFEVLDKKYVYVVDKNNVVKSRKITIVAEMPDLYVIAGDIKETDKILLEGLRIVNENDKITYKFVDPKTVISGLKIHAE